MKISGDQASGNVFGSDLGRSNAFSEQEGGTAASNVSFRDVLSSKFGDVKRRVAVGSKVSMGCPVSAEPCESLQEAAGQPVFPANALEFSDVSDKVSAHLKDSGQVDADAVLDAASYLAVAMLGLPDSVQLNGLPDTVSAEVAGSVGGLNGEGDVVMRQSCGILNGWHSQDFDAPDPIETDDVSSRGQPNGGVLDQTGGVAEQTGGVAEQTGGVADQGSGFIPEVMLAQGRMVAQNLIKSGSEQSAFQLIDAPDSLKSAQVTLSARSIVASNGVSHGDEQGTSRADTHSAGSVAVTDVRYSMFADPTVQGAVNNQLIPSEDDVLTGRKGDALGGHPALGGLSFVPIEELGPPEDSSKPEYSPSGDKSEKFTAGDLSSVGFSAFSSTRVATERASKPQVGGTRPAQASQEFWKDIADAVQRVRSENPSHLSLNLRLSDGSMIDVEFRMISSGLHATFKTESHELLAALKTQWSHFLERNQSDLRVASSSFQTDIGFDLESKRRQSQERREMMEDSFAASALHDFPGKVQVALSPSDPIPLLQSSNRLSIYA